MIYLYPRACRDRVAAENSGREMAAKDNFWQHLTKIVSRRSSSAIAAPKNGVDAVISRYTVKNSSFLVTIKILSKLFLLLEVYKS